MQQFHLDAQLDVKSTASDAEWGRFSGVVSTNDRDLQDDVIEAGAFDPIDERNVALLFSHDRDQPVGKWESLRQEGGKLVARGALLLRLQKAREVYDMVRAGVLNGLSVGFRVLDPSDVVRAGGRRRIKRAKLCEISLVSVPANSGCRILEVRSVDGFGSASQRLAALEAEAKADSRRHQLQLLDVEARLAAAVEAQFKVGEIEPDRAAALLRQIIANQRAASL